MSSDSTVVLPPLTGREHLAPEEKQYLDVLSDLIEKYEEEHHPMKATSPVEALAFLMETNHLRQADIAHLFSSKSNLSEVLSGRRELSKAQIVRLAKSFRVSPALFLEAG